MVSELRCVADFTVSPIHSPSNCRYLLMLAYALHSQMRRHGCMLSADSCMGLAFAGVLTVTFASVAGLGLATWFGIEFNAATTQVALHLTCLFCPILAVYES